MKRIHYICIVFVLFAFFTSCSKEKQTLTDNTWIAESLKVHTDSVWVHSSERASPITLSFRKKNEYLLVFGGSKSSGRVKIAKNKIDFIDAMTMGSWSDYPFDFLCWELLLVYVTHYTIDDNKLTLEGDNGEIIILIKQ